MVVKGIISATYNDGTAEVILTEHDDVVTPRIPFYGAQKPVGAFVVVAVFSDNFADSVIL